MTPSTSFGLIVWMVCETSMRLEHWAAIATANRMMIILINQQYQNDLPNTLLNITTKRSKQSFHDKFNRFFGGLRAKIQESPLNPNRFYIKYTGMNEYKRDLLNKPHLAEEVNEEWIMLEDLNTNNSSKGINQYQQNKTRKEYQRIDDDVQRRNPMQSNNYRDPRKIEEIPKETPFNPKVITINGQTFQEVDKDQPAPKPKPKKTKLPQMHVSCYFCTLVQSVPGTSERFICGGCNKDNSCTPIYKIFLCGTCDSKVCYAVGTSQLIKCTKCGTVNKVPAVSNPYEVQFKIPSSLDERFQRETEQLEELSQGGMTELHEDYELREYFGKQNIRL